MILMVDDSPEDADQFRQLIEPSGHDVRSTRTARDALQVLQTMKPGLLVVDLGMPDMDGFALLAELRRRPELADVPVLVYTISDNPEDRRRALDAGASEFVTKQTVSPQSLRELVDRLYRRP